MFRYCYSDPRGYDEREAASASASDLPTESDNRFVSELDLPIGAYDDDMADIGIALDNYIRGYDY